MLYNQNKSCVKSCQKTLVSQKTHRFPEKPIVFQKNPSFSNMCTFLSHCFETKNYHCQRASIFMSNRNETMKCTR